MSKFCRFVFRVISPLCVLVSAGAAAVACGGDPAGRPRFLSIATGGTGGVFYPYGGGLAKVLNESLPGIRASAEVTSASIDNLKLIRDNKADIAFTTADVLADAVRGQGAFEGARVRAVALAALYVNYAHLVTLRNSGIHRIADLKGRVVSVGSPGSGAEVTAFRLLHAAGLDPSKDITRQGLGVTESAGALKDGKIDAFFWNGGVPTPALQDLAYSQGVDMRIVSTAAALPELRSIYGDIYLAGEVPVGVYRGVDAAVALLGTMVLLVVNQAMDEQLAYDITRVLFERQSDLAAIHPEARKLTLKTAMSGSPAAFHPGAVRFYRAQGVIK
jgi:TRAP transporter TAXI family solute receptor